MNIPSEAHTAAREAEYDWNTDKRPTLSRVEYMLRAAAPFIAAQELTSVAHLTFGPGPVRDEILRVVRDVYEVEQ